MPDKLQIFECGPSRPECECRCHEGQGVCGHVWDGPDWESEDGLVSSRTCSKCGMPAIDHDMWIGP